jgi:tRNA (guanine-N7-)-methyltransferase
MNQTPEPSGLRPIRSFVRRQGRMTPAQQAAWDTLWPQYGLDPAARLETQAVFGRTAPLTLEIGFGNGESLATMAADSPQMDFIGVEVHRPGVGHLLLKIRELGLRNVRIYCTDAVDLLKTCIPERSLDAIQVFFPDPWHKKRHHKRRLLNPEFVALARNRLKLRGTIHCATDWEHYAGHMMEVLEGCDGLRNAAGNQQFSERPATRPLTKFEARGQRLGHGVWDLLFVRDE